MFCCETMVRRGQIPKYGQIKIESRLIIGVPYHHHHDFVILLLNQPNITENTASCWLGGVFLGQVAAIGPRSSRLHTGFLLFSGHSLSLTPLSSCCINPLCQPLLCLTRSS